MAEAASKPAVPGWFWAVAVIALIWEALGCYAYLTQIGAADDAQPAWISAAFAVAVWVGVSGAILLLMRQSLARTAFLVSLIGAVLQFGGGYLTAPPNLPLGAMLGLGAVVILAGVGLFWFAHRSVKRGWLS